MATTARNAVAPLTEQGRRLVSDWYPRALRRDGTRQLHAKLGDLTVAKHVLVIADSNGEGDSVSKDVNRSFTWWSELQRMLRTQYDPNGADDNASYFPVHFGSAGAAGLAYVSAWTSTGTVTNLDTLTTASGMGLRANSFATSANFMTFTGVGTDFEVWYRAGPGQGTFRIVLDGVALGTTCPTARAGGVLGGRTFSTGMTGLAYGTHTVRVQPNGAVGNDTIFLEGIKVYNGGISSGIHVWDSAHGGFRAYDFNTSVTSATFADIANTADAVAGGKTFDHIIIALGTIDAIGNSRTPAQYASDLTTMMTNFNAQGYTGGYTLVFPPTPGGGSTTPVAQSVMDGLRDAAKSLAVTNANVDFLDLAGPMPTALNGTNAAPLAITGGDNVHYLDRGAAWVARIIGEAIMPKRGHVLSGYKPGNLAAANDPRFSQIGVRACATASITLSGTQTVDGVALGVDDLVLVLGQGFNATNGVYQVKGGASPAWVRPAHVPFGMVMPTAWSVQVAQGNLNIGEWVCSNGTPTTVGATVMIFQQLGLDPNRMLFSAKACATGPITLSTPQTVDGIALVAGDVCLATAQGSLATNGLWVVQAAGWTRPAVAPSGVTLPISYMVSVGLGSTAGIGLWQSVNGTPIVVDTTNQFFGRPNIGTAATTPAYPRRVFAFQTFR